MQTHAVNTKQQWSEMPDKKGLQLVQLKSLHQKNKCHRLFCIKNRQTTLSDLPNKACSKLLFNVKSKSDKQQLPLHVYNIHVVCLHLGSYAVLNCRSGS